MKTVWKSIKRLLLVALLAGLVFAINLIWFRPFFISHFYDKIFFEFAWHKPQLLSSMGIGWFNDQLDDTSPEASERDKVLLQKDYKQLLEYDRSSLSGQAALSYDILEYFLKQQMEDLQFEHHGYSMTQRGGSYLGLISFMTNDHQIESEEDAEDYLSRVAQFDDRFDSTMHWVNVEREMGVIPPDFIVSKVLENLHNIRDNPVESHPLMVDFSDKVKALDDIDATRKDALLASMRSHIENVVNPAYDRLLDLFEELQSVATADAGVWKLPDGARYYQNRIKSMTTTDYTAEELHQIGLREVNRIVGEMRDILSSEGYSGASVGEMMAQLNEEERFLYPDTDAGREQILSDYQRIIDEIDAGMDQSFDIRPKSGVEVKRVPEYAEKTSSGAYYQGPALDGSRPGVFFANLYDIKATPKFGMRTLAYHEAVPGHHFQIAIKTELQGLPRFRNFVGFTAYSEGWALYAERLAWEMGFQQDPFDNLGRLQAELMRAVRLVVDTGIHHKRWSRERAIEYMASTTGMAMSDVESEIERYIVWPGQALAYKVGMIKILELRDKAQRALGENYDIRTFHNVVLKNGALPLVLLEREVDSYIAKGGKI